MFSRLSLVAVLAVLFLPACGNTLNPFCTSPAPRRSSRRSPPARSFQTWKAELCHDQW